MKKTHIKTVIAILAAIICIHGALVFAASPRPVYIIADQCNKAGDVNIPAKP